MGCRCATTVRGRGGRDDEQRPQAELKPAAFAFRRVGFGRLTHRRIVPYRGLPEQEILARSAPRRPASSRVVAGFSVGSLGTQAASIKAGRNEVRSREPRLYPLQISVGSLAREKDGSNGFVAQPSAD